MRQDLIEILAERRSEFERPMHYFGQPEETLHLKELQKYQLLTTDDEDTFCSDTALSETETISIDPQFLHHGDLCEFVDD